MIDETYDQVANHEDLDAYQEELAAQQDQLYQDQQYDDQQVDPSQNELEVNAQEGDLELKKKVVLYYHELFQASMSHWFVLMQQTNYQKLSRKQYIDLNVRIQKSLILDFDFDSAKESAEQDWKIDLEREQTKSNKTDKLGEVEEEPELDSDAESEIVRERDARIEKRAQDKFQAKSDIGIRYERLSEFFFDLCLSWGQHLDIETFLFFSNGVFLNITEGQHINVSQFKPLEEIKVLSIEFFNHLLAYRSLCEERALQNESYNQWHVINFQRTHEMVQRVEQNLQDAFRHNKNENRILDIWLDLPAQIINQFVESHFRKMNRDLKKVEVACTTVGRLVQSIQIMEQIKNIGSKTGKIPMTSMQYQATITSNAHSTALPHRHVKVYNDKPEIMGVIEKRLIGQLGEPFQNAQLIELSRNSYLISNQVRLPIIGQQQPLHERNKENQSRKGFQVRLDAEFYNSRRVNEPNLSNLTNVNFQKYVLDPVFRQKLMAKLEDNEQQNVDIQYAQNKNVSPNATSTDTAREMTNQQLQQLQESSAQPTSQILEEVQNRQLVAPITADTNYIYAKNDLAMDLVSQAKQNSFNKNQSYSVDNNLQQLNGMGIRSNDGGRNNQPTLQSESNININNNQLNEIYDQYLVLLQGDAGAKIGEVLKNEPYAREMQQGLYTEEDIEVAIYNKLYQEEESSGIQSMIAQFYQKFDELHEQSLSQALARSPNKITLKNEVKYRVPERWTKKFHKEDIIGQIKPFGQQNEINSGAHQGRTQVVPRQLVPDFGGEKVTGMQQQEDEQNYKVQNGSPDGAGESTDAQSRFEDTDSKANFTQHTFDWSQVAYLFQDGVIPDEIASITDPVEYNYLMVRLRKEFNDKHKSNYLKYMALNLPYHSRRDEVGGAITEQDWTNFVTRLEGIIDKVAKKRSRIIRRRKKKGKKKLPRKTLFKPEKQLQVGKDPLWREIFIDQKEDQSDSESDDNEDEFFRMYREALAQKGVKISSDAMPGARRVNAQSAKVELFNRKNGHDVDLPPIKYPSMHPKEKPTTNYLEMQQEMKFQLRKRRQETENKQNTAEYNLKSITKQYPSAIEHTNFKLEPTMYPDPFVKQNEHIPNRTYNINSPMTKKLVHNYTDKVRQQSREMQGRGKTLRQSAVTILQNGASHRHLLEENQKKVAEKTNVVGNSSNGEYQQNLWGGILIKNGRLSTHTQQARADPFSGRNTKYN